MKRNRSAPNVQPYNDKCTSKRNVKSIKQEQADLMKLLMEEEFKQSQQFADFFSTQKDEIESDLTAKLSIGKMGNYNSDSSDGSSISGGEDDLICNVGRKSEDEKSGDDDDTEEDYYLFDFKGVSNGEILD
eukprot:Pgem_evm1s13857